MFTYAEANRLYERIMDVLVRDNYTEHDLKEAEKLLQKALKEVQGK